MNRILLLLALVTGLSTSAFALSAAAPAPAAKYPLTTCVVSGDSLDDPVPYVYKQAGKPDRLVEFCCKDCIADFQKDPAKYLAKLDAAAAAQKTAAANGAAATAAACPSGASCPMGHAMASAMPAACPMQPGSTAGACTNPGSCPAMHGTRAMTMAGTGPRAIRTAETAGVPNAGWLKHYIPVADALAADNLAAAKSAAATLAKAAAVDPAIAGPASSVARASSLDAARAAFKALSVKMEPLANAAKGYVVMHCPMAKADWIQTDAKVRNPYLGRMMSTCGAPKDANMAM